MPVKLLKEEKTRVLTKDEIMNVVTQWLYPFIIQGEPLTVSFELSYLITNKAKELKLKLTTQYGDEGYVFDYPFGNMFEEILETELRVYLAQQGYTNFKVSVENLDTGDYKDYAVSIKAKTKRKETVTNV